MKTFKSVLPCIAVILAAVSSNAIATQAYKVTASLSHSGQVFGSPVVVVQSGTPADIAVTGPDTYKLKLTVSPAGADKLKVAAILESQFGSMSPVVVVRSGQPATVSSNGVTILLMVEQQHGS